MKFILTATLLLALQGIQAQAPKVLNYLKATTETIREGGDGDMPMMPNTGTTITAMLKDSMYRLDIKSAFFNNTTITNTTTGSSITITEMQGEKNAFIQTKEEKAEQKRRQDSIRKAREQNGEPAAEPGRNVVRAGGGIGTIKLITYTADVKVINKINCKHAIVTTVNNDGEESKIMVWYTDEYTLPKEVSLSTGRGGMANFGDLKGIPVSYETKRVININGNEMIMTNVFEIQEIKTDAVIADKEFSLPKGIKVKTYAEYLKDNPNGMGGQNVIRMRM